MRKKKQSGKRENNTIKIIIATLLNIIIIYLIFLSFNNNESNRDIVTAVDIPSEEVDPEDFQDLTLETISEAVTEANAQLTNMQYGNINTIDIEDDYFFGRLIRDYEMGEIVYWDFGDSETDISIDAHSKEIITYLCYEWSDGSISQSQAEFNAIQIASQFAQFPSSYSGPSTDLYDVSSYYEYNATTNSTTFYEQKNWLLKYNRTKNQIVTEDHIEVWLNLNGDLGYYYKNWNMDLDSFPTNYVVNQQDAEETALDAAGEGSSVDLSFKIIIRPNRYWDGEGFSFGEAPSLAWEVWVTDSDGMLSIYHIDGNENEIIGGDSQ